MRPHLDLLMFFGFMSMVAAVVCWNLAAHGLRAARLLLAGSLAALALYAFLAGAWPLGIIAIVASAMAVRWWQHDKCGSVNAAKIDRSHRSSFSLRRDAIETETRLSRLFGPGAN
jgi:hypothetical protein